MVIVGSALAIEVCRPRRQRQGDQRQAARDALNPRVTKVFSFSFSEGKAALRPARSTLRRRLAIRLDFASTATHPELRRPTSSPMAPSAAEIVALWTVPSGPVGFEPE